MDPTPSEDQEAPSNDDDVVDAEIVDDDDESKPADKDSK
jgi:hypothetical protein